MVWNWSDQGTPAPGITVDGDAIGVITYANRPYVFVRGSDGHLWANWWDGSAWHWTDQSAPSKIIIDGNAIATLSVSNFGYRPYVFVRNEDGDLLAHYWNGSEWTWSLQGTPPGRTVDGNAIGIITYNRPYVFVRGSDGHLWANWWDGSAWHWTDQGIPPSRTSNSHVDGNAIATLNFNNFLDRPYVFVRGSEGALWTNYYNGSTWDWDNQGRPTNLGGGVDGNALGVITYANRPYVFFRGIDGHLGTNWWDGSAWHWSDQGTPAPGMTVDRNAIGTVSFENRPYVFVRGSDGHLWTHYWDGSAWVWRNQSTLTIDGNAISALSWNNRPYVFVRGNDGHLWTNWWS